METKVFNNGYVGYKVNTIKEVVNAQAAGLKICNENGYYFNDYIEVVNPETGEDEERAPTDDEILQSIQEAMENEYPVYATFYLDCGKVVPDKATTLQSSFRLGQKVYYMSENRIASGNIMQIDFAYGYNNHNYNVTIQKERYLVCHFRNENPKNAVTEKITLSGDKIFKSIQDITNNLQSNIKEG